MTLLVAPYIRDSEGALTWLPVPDNFSDLAGIESSRITFWSAPDVKRLGLTLLSTLAHADIYAEGSELLQLQQETAELVAHLPALFCTPDLQSYWRFRLANIQAAVEIAKAKGGGVYVG